MSVDRCGGKGRKQKLCRSISVREMWRDVGEEERTEWRKVGAWKGSWEGKKEQDNGKGERERERREKGTIGWEAGEEERRNERDGKEERQGTRGDGKEGK